MINQLCLTQRTRRHADLLSPTECVHPYYLRIYSKLQIRINVMGYCQPYLQAFSFSTCRDLCSTPLHNTENYT